MPKAYFLVPKTFETPSGSLGNFLGAIRPAHLTDLGIRSWVSVSDVHRPNEAAGDMLICARDTTDQLRALGDRPEVVKVDTLRDLKGLIRGRAMTRTRDIHDRLIAYKQTAIERRFRHIQADPLDYLKEQFLVRIEGASPEWDALVAAFREKPPELTHAAWFHRFERWHHLSERVMLDLVGEVWNIRGGAVVFTETWTGPNSDPWPADWTSVAGGNANVTDIQGNRGRVIRTGGGGNIYGEVINSIADMENSRADFTYEMVTTVNNRFAWLTRWNGLLAGVTAYVTTWDTNVDRLEVHKFVVGADTTLGVFATITVDGQVYHAWTRTEDDGGGGTDIKMEQDAASEPGTYDLEVLGDAEVALQGVSDAVGYAVFFIGFETNFRDNLNVDNLAAPGGVVKSVADRGLGAGIL